MAWYYAKNRSQCGPVTEDQLKELIRNNSIQPSDLVWKEGMESWIPSSEAPELFSLGQSGGGASDSPYQTPYTSSQMLGNAGNENIPTYLWQSVAVTLLCCVPGGIVAIIYASKVDGLIARGDIAGAQSSSKSAKNWCLASSILGLAFSCIYVFSISS